MLEKEKTDKKALQLEILNQITKSTIIVISLEEMMKNITGELQKVVSYDLLNFCLLENGELVIKTGVPKVELLEEGRVLSGDNSAPWKVIKEKKFLMRRDIKNDDYYLTEDNILLELNIKSVLIVPLIVKNKVIGTFNLGSKEEGFYEESDYYFIQQVADQLAVFIENSRLYNEEKRLKLEWKNCYKNSNSLMKELVKKNAQLEIINKITKSITVETSFDEMLNSISSKLQAIKSYDLLSFCLLENNNLIIKKGIPRTQKYLCEGSVLDSVNSAPAKAMKYKKTYIRMDIKNDSNNFCEDEELIHLGINSAIVVPLLVKNDVIGTLNLGSKEVYAYTIEDGEFLQQIADHLAICIENSRLYMAENQMKTEWENTFKAVTDIMYLIDKNFSLKRFNKAAIDFGESNGREPEIDEYCFNVFGEDTGYCKNCPAVEVFNNGQTNVKEVCRGSGAVWEIYSYPVFDNKGNVERVINVIKDITTKVEMENQLVQTAKLAAIGEIAAGVAHELNSPLTAIIGDCMLIKEEMGGLSDDQVELFDDIKNCGIRCKNIINNLRDFARQDNYNFSLININNVINNALDLVSYQIEKNNIEIIVDLCPDIKYINGSTQHIEQLIVNLVLNARDAVEYGSERYIIIKSGNREEGGIYVEISDTGCGMEQGELSKIFNPFYTTKLDSNGTGLGLSISKRIIDEHEGEVYVDSIKGKGTTFTVIFPEGSGGS